MVRCGVQHKRPTMFGIIMLVKTFMLSKRGTVFCPTKGVLTLRESQGVPFSSSSMLLNHGPLVCQTSFLCQEPIFTVVKENGGRCFVNNAVPSVLYFSQEKRVLRPQRRVSSVVKEHFALKKGSHVDPKKKGPLCF